MSVEITPDPFVWLHSEAELSWAAWYASPLTETLAQDLQTQARQRLQQAMTQGQNALTPRLAELIARFNLGRDVSHEYRSLMATLPETQCALVELIYGQLLMSCKCSAATPHLNDGFERAAAALAPEAYFVILRRHSMLSHLVLTPAGVAAQSLADLLQEARVIQRLRTGGNIRRSQRISHDDTLG